LGPTFPEDRASGAERIEYFEAVAERCTYNLNRNAELGQIPRCEIDLASDEDGGVEGGEGKDRRGGGSVKRLASEQLN